MAHPLLSRLAPVALSVLTVSGCLLEPLIEDTPGASVHVLPPDAEVPGVDEDPELVHQITVNDGLDDRTLMEAGGVIARLTGWAGGVQVRYWSFGKSPKVAAAAYVLVDAAGARIDHPWLFDAVPGDTGYSPIRRLHHVVVTHQYRGERLVTPRALADAVDLGLVLAPESVGTWVDAPVVPPGVTLDVGVGLAPAQPIEVYSRGMRVHAFVFGGERGVQPLRSGAVPVGQLSQLREGANVALLPAPIFQYAPPAAPPPPMMANYTPLATVIEVQLAPGVIAADTVRADTDLFSRATTGAIRATTASVASFVVTTTVLNWPQQFQEGLP